MSSSPRQIMVLAALALNACGRVHFGDTGTSDGRPGDGRTIDGARDGALVPVALDAVTSNSAQNVNSLTWPHTINDSSAALFVFVSIRNSSGAQRVTGVSANGMALGNVTYDCPSCSTGGINNYELWMLSSVSAGTLVLTATVAGTVEGVSAIAMSYAGAGGTVVDMQTSTSSSSTTPSLGWTASTSARFAIGGAMDQGGNLMSLVPSGPQNGRSDTICDPSDYEAQLVADQTLLPSTSLSFVWSFASGTYGTGNFCNLSNTPHAWIAIGASFL